MLCRLSVSGQLGYGIIRHQQGPLNSTGGDVLILAVLQREPEHGRAPHAPADDQSHDLARLA